MSMFVAGLIYIFFLPPLLQTRVEKYADHKYAWENAADGDLSYFARRRRLLLLE